MADEKIHLDHNIIYSIVEPESRVLDLGCGQGDLLYPLVRDKRIRAQGIELTTRRFRNASGKD
jgi:cyclopropane fatty-acyl-phospholipid synthase-like methyltransferase